MQNQTHDMTVSHQWVKRPDDERFTSLTALAAYTKYRREHSAQRVIPNRKLQVLPSATDQWDVAVCGPNGNPAQFTHWSFSQYASLAGVPAGYLRSGLPGALIADNLNWGMQHLRSVEDIGVLLSRNGDAVPHLRAATGPNYGRIWDTEITENLRDLFGDGISGDWRIPGEFGKKVAITKQNTTIYGSDRDMWVFLADETNRVEIPNRRDGSPGSLARGFYIGNSEVGSKTLTIGMWLFDYACYNRILWGVNEKQEISIRHTTGAPFRWNEEIKPILQQFARTDIDPRPIQATIKAAQEQKLMESLETFLANRFGKSMVNPIIAAHQADEQRPIETIFDVVTGATAYAQTIPHQDQRVLVERAAGQLLTNKRQPRSLAESLKTLN